MIDIPQDTKPPEDQTSPVIRQSDTLRELYRETAEAQEALTAEAAISKLSETEAQFAAHSGQSFSGASGATKQHLSAELLSFLLSGSYFQ